MSATLSLGPGSFSWLWAAVSTENVTVLRITNREGSVLNRTQDNFITPCKTQGTLWRGGRKNARAGGWGGLIPKQHLLDAKQLLSP